MSNIYLDSVAKPAEPLRYGGEDRMAKAVKDVPAWTCEESHVVWDGLWELEEAVLGPVDRFMDLPERERSLRVCMFKALGSLRNGMPIPEKALEQLGRLNGAES